MKLINLYYYILDTPEEDLSDTIRSVSSQMGNKEMSGFTLFAREMRIKSINLHTSQNEIFEFKTINSIYFI